MFVAFCSRINVNIGQKMREGDKRSLQRKDQCAMSILLIGLHFLTDFYVLNVSRKHWTCLKNEDSMATFYPSVVIGSPLKIIWQRKYMGVIDIYLYNVNQQYSIITLSRESDFRKLSIILLKSFSSDNSIYMNTFILQWLCLKRYSKMFCFLI